MLLPLPGTVSSNLCIHAACKWKAFIATAPRTDAHMLLTCCPHLEVADAGPCLAFAHMVLRHWHLVLRHLMQATGKSIRTQARGGYRCAS